VGKYMSTCRNGKLKIEPGTTTTRKKVMVREINAPGR